MKNNFHMRSTSYGTTPDFRVFSLSNPQRIYRLLREKSWKIISLCFPGSYNNSLRIHLLYRFVRFILLMYKNHGSLLTVKWLKAGTVSIQKSLGGDKISSLRVLEPDLPLPRLSTSGLPVIIPATDRGLIKDGNTGVTRFWLTLFGLYRILESPFKPKLNTITDPFSGSIEKLDELVDFFAENSRRLFSPYSRGIQNSNLAVKEFTAITSASPNSRISWKGANVDLLTIFKLPQGKSVKPALLRYGIIIGNGSALWLDDHTGRSILSFAGDWQDLIPKSTYGARMDALLKTKILDSLDAKPSIKTYSDLRLGQLSFKEEAAGKLRVFAMVDYITQNFLRPLHDRLFALLRSLPNDGTFDQNASVRRCIEKAKLSGVAYSFDLSAATDRLPVAIQAAILDGFFPDHIGIGETWRRLLVDRDYIIPENGYGIEPGPIRYAVGQPMGALSSWAMLAVCHHGLLQYISYEVLGGNTYNSQYEVLGDDILIFDKRLAMEYLKLMKSLGVEINLNKSISSETASAMEFAKRTIYHQVDVAGLSWRDFIVSDESVMTRITLLLNTLQKGLPLTRTKLMIALGDNKFVTGILGKGGKLLSRRTPGLVSVLNYILKDRMLDTTPYYLVNPDYNGPAPYNLRELLPHKLPGHQILTNIIASYNSLPFDVPNLLSWSKIENRMRYIHVVEHSKFHLTVYRYRAALEKLLAVLKSIDRVSSPIAYDVPTIDDETRPYTLWTKFFIGTWQGGPWFWERRSLDQLRESVGFLLSMDPYMATEIAHDTEALELEILQLESIARVLSDIPDDDKYKMPSSRDAFSKWRGDILSFEKRHPGVIS